MDSLTNALDALAKSAVLIVAPEGVGCCDLAPLVLDLKSGVPDLNAKAGAQL